LPRQVRRRGIGNRLAQIGVGDAAERRDELRWERAARRDRSRGAPLGGTIERRQRADAEAQLADRDAALAQAIADRLGEKGQLVGPHAARNTEQQHAVAERDGVCSLGDARSDCVAPERWLDRGVRARETAFAGTIEDGLEGLGRSQLRATAAHTPELSSLRSARRSSTVAAEARASRAGGFVLDALL
jgi:hypothetical protein